jgi:hypothetical protein
MNAFYISLLTLKLPNDSLELNTAFSRYFIENVHANWVLPVLQSYSDAHQHFILRS